MRRLGNFFYYYRSILPIPFYLLILYYGILTRAGLLWGSIFIASGFALRIWASGFSDATSRYRYFSIHQVITSGPYRYSRHPLYLGNFLLTLGVLILYAPGLFITLVVILLFLFEYLTIITAEESFLIEKAGAKYEEYKKSVAMIIGFKSTRKRVSQEQRFL
ncbi:MAG: isoprenylcysteine carboxylmethyltransferase family protein, partial [candidate division WOR-3 bacterium]